jgi:hypothetical protein
MASCSVFKKGGLFFRMAMLEEDIYMKKDEGVGLTRPRATSLVQSASSSTPP